MNTGWEIAAAVLTVIGVYCLVRTVGELFFTPKAVTLCILVRERCDLTGLDILLGEAYRHSLRVRGHAVVVLIDPALLTADARLCRDGTSPGECAVCTEPPHPDAATLALLDKWGAVWYPLPDAEARADAGGEN